MKTKIQIFIAAFVLFYLPPKVNAQEALVSSGGNAESTTGTISYTVGQTAFNYYGGSNGAVSQGVQQPYEIFLVTGSEDIRGILLDCMVYYPNPVQDHLQLKIEGLEWGKLRWGIYDLSGKLLKEDRVANSLSTIPVVELKQGTYLFSISDTKNSTIKTFKIIKN